MVEPTTQTGQVERSTVAIEEWFAQLLNMTASPELYVALRVRVNPNNKGQIIFHVIGCKVPPPIEGMEWPVDLEMFSDSTKRTEYHG